MSASDLSAPDTKAGKLQRACLKLLREHERADTIPTNVTFLFYELEQRGILPKHYLDADGRKRARTPRQDVSDATMRLRKLSLVPWWWIVDESRDVEIWRFARTVYEYAIDSVKHGRIDCWGGKPAPLILCESRATKGVLSRIAAECLAPIGATGGMAGGYLVNNIAPLLEGNERKVLYVGDHEVGGPGDQIEANSKRYLEQHASRTFTTRNWTRVALTQEQVDANPRLLELVITKTDARSGRRYEAVECEAVGQAELEQMLRRRLSSLLPEPLKRVRMREDRQRRAVAVLLRRGR